MTKTEVELHLSNLLMPSLSALFENEELFLLNLSDCIRRLATDERLSDSQKYLIRFDRPFGSSNGASAEKRGYDSSEHAPVDIIEI